MSSLKNILYLASQSPRRREILTRMGVRLRVVNSSYHEKLKQKVIPAELALEHAEGKARAARLPNRARFVLGADTVVVCKNKILGKPRNEKDALVMIQLLSGGLNEVITGVALWDRKTGILTRVAAHSRVFIKKMNRAECLNYVRHSQPYDKAGGYAIQGRPRIARRIRGSYSNIVGCPRELVRRLLKQAGFFGLVLLCLGAGLQHTTAWAADPKRQVLDSQAVPAHPSGPADPKRQVLDSQAVPAHQSGAADPKRQVLDSQAVPAHQGWSGESTRVRSAHTEASLVSELTAVQPGRPMRIALRLRMDPDWHTYWINSGDSGLATSLQWTLPEGFSAGPIEWPYPSPIRQDPLVTYGYYGEVWLFTTLQVPDNLILGSQVTLNVKADWLECEVPCMPGQADLFLELSVAAEGQVSPEWQKGAAEFLTKLPKPAPIGQFMFEQNERVLILKSSLGAQGAYFFPYDGELFDHAAPQVLKSLDGALSLEIHRSRLKNTRVEALAGVLLLTVNEQPQAYELNVTEQDVLKESAALSSKVVAAKKRVVKETPQIQQPDESTRILAVEPLPTALAPEVKQKPISLRLALLSAFLGGLILNLMPCVLPVLSLKILGFVTQRGHPGELRAHALIWTLGVLVSFWILSGLMLALRWGGSSLGWGFHLQSPGMVAALMLVFLLLALNMAGFFEVGLLLTRYAGKVSNPGEKNSQAFAAGVLAVVAATPCTAPFMGAAVGYALIQPVFVVLAVFTCLGLGMAFPFLLLAFAPGGLKFLPRPGPWMNTFKKILALPLGLTVVWLLWVLTSQVKTFALSVIAGSLLVSTVAAILYGRRHLAALAGDRRARRQSRLLLSVLFIAVVTAIGSAVLGGGVGQKDLAGNLSTSPHKGVQWKVFSREEVGRLVEAGKPVFIDFTARWCLSCQVNDRLVFQTAEVADLFKARGIHAFMADWTSKDNGIAEALAGYGRASVPLYVFYDGKNKSPRFLPEVLTIRHVREALEAVS